MGNTSPVGNRTVAIVQSVRIKLIQPLFTSDLAYIVNIPRFFIFIVFLYFKNIRLLKKLQQKKIRKALGAR